MRAAREHPRLAAAVATALVLMVLASIAAASALAGNNSASGARSRASQAANAQIGALQRRLQAGLSESAQLRTEIGGLQARLANVRDVQQPTPCAPATKSRRRKR